MTAGKISEHGSSVSSLTIGIFILGDEILSGKREDRHFAKVREILSSRGLGLSWVQYLGDDRERCVLAFKQSLASGDLVFSFGGIGSTPDDHTRQAVAQALNRPLVLHPEAEPLIRQRSKEMGQPCTPERLRMGEFPAGAEIIANPYNRIPGFSVHRHYFLPGFPVMAWPMMESVLDQYYSAYFSETCEIDQSLLVVGIFEATVTPLLERLDKAYPDLRIYSLPAAPIPGDSGPRRLLELGVKARLVGGNGQGEERLASAYEELKQGVIALGGSVSKESLARR
jgi:molybdopterin-biosynthesis enzyme MoeA-like protein